MYEDDPQDHVFDILGGAIFGEHPLGRPIIGAPRGGRRDAGGVDRRLPRRPLPARQRGARGRRVGRPRPPGGARRRAHPRRRRAAPPSPIPRPSGPQPSVRIRVKDTEQYHVCLGAPGVAARRRPPLHAADPGRDLRRELLLAPLPGDSREARARLRGVLVHGPVRGHRAGRPVPGHAARTTSPRRCGWWRPSSSASAPSRCPTPSSCARKRARQGPPRALAGVHLRAHEPPGLLGADRRPAALGGRVDGAHRGGGCRAGAGAGAPSCWMPTACRRRAWGPTRASSAPRSSRWARDWPPRRERDPRRRRRRRRQDGPGGVRGGGGRGGHDPGRARRPAPGHHAWPRRCCDADVAGRLHPARHRAGERAGRGGGGRARA